MNLTMRLALAVLLAECASSQAVETNRWQIIRDIEYARIGEQVLKLDLHLPDAKARSPLIIWVHGGAWRSGSRKDMPLAKLVEAGYAVVQAPAPVVKACNPCAWLDCDGNTFAASTNH